MQTKEGKEITDRFFQALEILKAHKTIRGVKTFTDYYKINRRNLIAINYESTTQNTVKIEWLVYLIRDFNFSAEWLLLGREPVFKRGKTPVCYVDFKTPKLEPTETQAKPAKRQE